MDSRCFPNLMNYDIDSSEFNIEKVIDKIDEYVTLILKHITTEKLDHNGYIYTGYSGIAYMFYRLSQNPLLSSKRTKYLKNAVTYINCAIEIIKSIPNEMTSIPSLMSGRSGVYAIAIAVFHENGNKSQSKYYVELYREAVAICKQSKFNPNGSDEFFKGRAGFIFGSLWLNHEINSYSLIDDLLDICDVIVQVGRKNAKDSPRRTSSLSFTYHRKEYVGAAHGLSSILLALLSVPGFIDNDLYVKDVRSSINYLLQLQFEDGNFPSSVCKPEKILCGHSDLVHWCHGAPGIIYVLAKAYTLWKDEQYLTACKKCADLIWSYGLLKKGCGLCHGVAGNGYAFLLMYRLTDNDEYLKKAQCFQIFMESDVFLKYSRTPDHPFSLFEGLAGATCFLNDMLQPKNAYFPFQNIFM